MSTRRRKMTARIVPLGGERHDDIVEGTIEERLALLAQLSEMSWRLTKRPLPEYSRSTMPAKIVPLRALGGGQPAE